MARRDEPQLDTRVFRDGRLHLMREECATCVFRPGNLMSLNPGALKRIIQGNIDAESALVCHKTLPYAPGGGEGAICRGFYERYRKRVPALVLADAMGMWDLQDPPDDPTEGER